jgi:WD40 repeat protein
MKSVKVLNIKKPIILIKVLEDGILAVVDSETTVRYFNTEDFSLVSGFKLGVKHLRYKTNMVAISNDAEYITTISNDGKESKLYNARTKKAIAKVSRHQGEVSCVGIDNSNRYMFSCGDDGKTFAVDMKSGKIVFTLPIHVDTVNDIAFSSNSNWVATASYDRKISLFNLTTMTPKAKLKAHADPIMKLHFLGYDRLVSVDKKASAVVWDVHSAKVIQRLEGIHDDPTQMVSDNENKFLFIGTSLGYVLLYDLKTYELLSKKFIKLSSTITSMEFNANTKNLILGSEDGNLGFYNIYEGEEKLQKLIKIKDFESMYHEVEINPILIHTQSYDLVEAIWIKTVKNSKIYLQKGDRKSAIALFKSFKNIPSKNKVMQNIMLEYEDYSKFATLAKQGKLPLAYSLANQHPMYKNSSLYLSLEKNWRKAFAQAQKYALEPKGADSAKQTLAPYRGISEKTKLIQELLTKGEIYKRFRVAIGQKDFTICFELIKQHPFLKEFPEYETIMNYADTLYIKSHEFIKVGDTHSAIKMLRILCNFTDFTQEVKILMQDIENKQKFFNAIEEDDTVLAYNLLASTDDLLETEDGQKLQTQWNDVLGAANEKAVDGDVQGVKEALNLYMNISSKYASIATVFGWCYMVQLENAIRTKKDKSVIEDGIKNYMLSFGLQDQIENFFRIFKSRYKDTKLSLEHLTKGSLSMWRPSMIVDSILE